MFTEVPRDHSSEVAQSRPTPCNPWTVAYQAPMSIGFSRQEYWSWLPSLKEPVGKKKSRDLPGSSVVKTLPSNAGGTGYIPA